MKKFLLAVSICSIMVCGCSSTPENSFASSVEHPDAGTAKTRNYIFDDCKIYYDRGQYEAALKACEATYSQGISESAIYLGDIYLFGRINNQIDVAKAVSYYESEGGVKGLYKAARVYEKGVNTDVNLPKALSYYEKAANQGDILSANYVANSYLKGRAAPKDEDKAIKYFKVAADAGDPKAQFQLACFYRDGKHTAKNDDLAYVYFSKAAAQKHTEALYEKAQMEENGIGTEKNINQAIETYRELVTRSNYTPAMYTLGKLLITTSSDEEDHNSGISFLEQASKKQYVPAKYLLGVEYIKGENVEKSTRRGIELIKECIEKGYAPAMYTFGYINERGLGVTKNDASAYAWYHIAADCGISAADNKYQTSLSNATLLGLSKLANQKYQDYKGMYKCAKFNGPNQIFTLN